VSSKFVLQVSKLEDFLPLGCTCNAQGGFEDPQFNAARSLTCTAPHPDDPVSVAFSGKVSPDRFAITTGRTTFSDGAAYIFACVRVATCDPGTEAAAARLASPYRH
jgi:hypothetical protein